MKKTRLKVFFTWDCEKEEAWINKMEDRGLHLIKVGLFRYVFESGQPGLYDYRVEIAQVSADSLWGREYTAFQTQAGVDLVGHFHRSLYWRKKRSQEGFDLFSDLDSRITYLKRGLKVTVLVAALLLFTAMITCVEYLTEFKEVYTLELIFWGVAFLVGCVNAISAWKIYRKIRSLKKERMLFE